MKKVDPAKMVIWVCLGLSAVGVGTHYWLEGKLEQASKDVKLCLTYLKEVAEKKAEIDELTDEFEKNTFLKSVSAGSTFSFFEGVATKAGLPPPSIGRQTDDTPRSGREAGYKDTSWEVTWERSARKRQRFDRERAAKFCWWIEDESKQLLKVTDIRLQTDPRQFDDLWEMTLWVTERRPGKLADSEG